MNRQGPCGFIACELQIALTDPRAKENTVAFACTHHILNCVIAVARIEHISVMAHTTTQQIVSSPPFEHVRSKTAL